MQSNGGLAAAESFHAMSSVLSGPAGGLIGMHWVGERLGYPRLIGFDMGGTSTDVSLIDGELPQRFEHLIAGVRLTQPMRSEEHTSELQSPCNLVCRLLLEKK